MQNLESSGIYILSQIQKTSRKKTKPSNRINMPINCVPHLNATCIFLFIFIVLQIMFWFFIPFIFRLVLNNLVVFFPPIISSLKLFIKPTKYTCTFFSILISIYEISDAFPKHYENVVSYVKSTKSMNLDCIKLVILTT